MTKDRPPLTPDDALLISRYRTWWESCATIRGREMLLDGSERITLTTAPELQMNDLQSQLDQAITHCELNNEPCKIIVLKPRKEGATTALVGKSYHLLRGTGAQLLQIGDQADTTQTMWDMLKTYQDTDAFDGWPSKLSRMTTSAKAGARAGWGHGSTAWAETAGDKRAGQGTTPTIVHAEEVAHWGRDGSAASASDTMLALLNAVPDIAGTYVFVSSTANGTGNWYFRTYKGAVSLAERKAGNKGNGWIKIFMPWHRSKWSRKRITEREQAEIADTMTDAERRGVKLWGWEPGQIAWRREQIASKCDGDEAKFAQEQPPDEIECFLTSGRPVFQLEGMARLETMSVDARPRIGRLEETGNGKVAFYDDKEDGWVVLYEEPTPGHSYIAPLDTCRNAQAEGAKDPDCHSFWVLRKRITKADGVTLNTRAACRIRHPCRWEPAVLCSKIALILKWYGSPLVVPEMNAGDDEMNRLRDMGFNIYRRQKFDRINPGKTLKVMGWLTDDKTRPDIVSALQEHVREQSLDLECPVAVSQFRTFERNALGKACAKSGCHDDDVMAIGIGLVCIEHATRMPFPERAPANYGGSHPSGVAKPSVFA
jgi:hypothetical protein